MLSAQEWLVWWLFSWLDYILWAKFGGMLPRFLVSCFEQGAAMEPRAAEGQGSGWAKGASYYCLDKL